MLAKVATQLQHLQKLFITLLIHRLLATSIIQSIDTLSPGSGSHKINLLLYKLTSELHSELAPVGLKRVLNKR
jgi:hypothetical protein